MTESTEAPSLAPTLAGNVPDPDARVIDSLVEQEATPPTPDELPKLPNAVPANVLVPTRLLTQTRSLVAAWGPVLLLPADPNRTLLTIRVASTTATDVVLVADDSGKLQGVADSALTLAVAAVTPLDGHTGPVWAVVPSSIAGAVTVTFAAVTK